MRDLKSSGDLGNTDANKLLLALAKKTSLPTNTTTTTSSVSSSSSKNSSLEELSMHVAGGESGNFTSEHGSVGSGSISTQEGAQQQHGVSTVRENREVSSTSLHTSLDASLGRTFKKAGGKGKGGGGVDLSLQDKLKLKARPGAGAGEELVFAGATDTGCCSWGQRPVSDVDNDNAAASSPVVSPCLVCSEEDPSCHCRTAQGGAVARDSSNELTPSVNVVRVAKTRSKDGLKGGSGGGYVAPKVLETSRRLRRPRPGESPSSKPGIASVTYTTFTAVPSAASSDNEPEEKDNVQGHDTFPPIHPVLAHASAKRYFDSEVVERIFLAETAAPSVARTGEGNSDGALGGIRDAGSFALPDSEQDSEGEGKGQEGSALVEVEPVVRERNEELNGATAASAETVVAPHGGGGDEDDNGGVYTVVGDAAAADSALVGINEGVVGIKEGTMAKSDAAVKGVTEKKAGPGAVATELISCREGDAPPPAKQAQDVKWLVAQAKAKVRCYHACPVGMSTLILCRHLIHRSIDRSVGPATALIHSTVLKSGLICCLSIFPRLDTSVICKAVDICRIIVG